jgi:GAF domain-containing protein
MNPPSHDVLILVALLVLTLVVLGWLVNRRLEGRRRLEVRVAQLENLGRVGRVLAEAQLDAEALYELILQQVSTIVDTSTFQLGLLEGRRYRIVVWVKEGVRRLAQAFELEQQEGLIGWVSQNKAPLLISDYQAEWDSLPARPGYQGDNPPRSAVFVPLITGDECIGVMVAQSYARNAFTQDHVRLLVVIANQAAASIVNARLYQQVQRRAIQLELVSQVARQVRALIPLRDFFEQVVQLIGTTFGYLSTSVYICDRDSQQAVLQASTMTPEDQDHVRLVAGQGLISWSLAHQETVLVNDVKSDPRYVPLSRLPATRAEMVVPLLVENQVLGALDLHSDQPGAFNADDRFALEVLADQVAIAIQEARLYEAERHQRSVAETLGEVARTITASLELEQVLPAILTDLGRVLPYDASAILLLEPDGVVVVKAVRGLPTMVTAEGHRFKLNDSRRLRRLAEGDQPLVFSAADDAGCFHERLGLPADHACLGSPLIGREGLIGFITADALVPHRYRPEDAAILATFAGHAAVAIDNARLYALQREQAWVSTSLLSVAEATSQFTELDQVLNAVTQMTLKLVGVARCGILLWDEEASGFRGSRLAGGDADLSEEFGRLVMPLTAWAPLAALKNRPRPIILGGAEALVELPAHLFDYFGLDAWLLLIPLMTKGALIGAMLVSGETAAAEMIRKQAHLMSGIANQAALAIDNAQLFAAQQEEAYVTIALLQVAEAVNQLTDLEAILSTVVRLAPLLAGVEQCVVIRYRPNSQVFSSGPGYGLAIGKLELLQHSLQNPTTHSLMNALRLAREPVGIGSGYRVGLPEVWLDLFETDGVLAIPLVARQVPVGALLVSLPAGGVPLGARRQNILSGIAHQASTAIENDRLYEEAAERQRMERELELAREIQTSFLPKIRPIEPGWSVDTLWQAARHVGGDFFDFFLMPADEGQSKWGVVIADVADKGVPAALYMALSRTLIRTIGLSRVDPAASLQRVNDLLLKDTQSDLFVSAIYAVWETASGVITYANAGHNPPICVRSDGSAQVLTENNMILGVLPDIAMENNRLLLNPGDLVVLYTDGITDALSAIGDDFGINRLIAAVCAHRHLSASGVVQGIQGAVRQFVGDTPQFDDLTVVAIKRDQPAAISVPAG